MHDFYLKIEIRFAAGKSKLSIKTPIYQISANRIFPLSPAVSHGTSVILCEEFSRRDARVHLTRSQEIRYVRDIFHA